MWYYASMKKWLSWIHPYALKGVQEAFWNQSPDEHSVSPLFIQLNCMKVLKESFA